MNQSLYRTHKTTCSDVGCATVVGKKRNWNNARDLREICQFLPHDATAMRERDRLFTMTSLSVRLTLSWGKVRASRTKQAKHYILRLSWGQGRKLEAKLEPRQTRRDRGKTDAEHWRDKGKDKAIIYLPRDKAATASRTISLTIEVLFIFTISSLSNIFN